MGKRARHKGATGGRGSAQRMKERQLGLQIQGFTKPMLDAMNTVARERFGVGIGVIVQEEERERAVAATLESDVAAAAFWQRRGIRRSAREHAATADVWSEKLKACAEQVAASPLRR